MTREKGLAAAQMGLGPTRMSQPSILEVESGC